MKLNRLALHSIRGVIDPYTLGFIIAIIGSTTSYMVHKDDSSTYVESDSKMESIEANSVEQSALLLDDEKKTTDK